MTDAAKIADLLLQIKAIKLNVRSPFTWASGIKSPIYCDNRISLSHPMVRNVLKQAFIKKIQQFPAFDVIAGVATAGIPHAAIIADELGLPLVYVRSKAKEHGRQNVIEGLIQAGQRVLVVEDLISTGGSSLRAISALLESGAIVVGLLAIFTYEMEDSLRKFEGQNIQVETLSDYSTLLSTAQKTNYIDEQDFTILKDWRKSPTQWKSPYSN